MDSLPLPSSLFSWDTLHLTLNELGSLSAPDQWMVFGVVSVVLE